MTKKPSVDDLYTAANWLDIDAKAEDAEACHRVRAWLIQQADALDARTLRAPKRHAKPGKQQR